MAKQRVSHFPVGL